MWVTKLRIMIIVLPLGIPGWGELLIIAGVIILLFGASKIPALMRGMGKGISEFKKGMNEKDEDEPAQKQIETNKANDGATDEQSLQ